jgi:protein phosphatase 1 regulatory subunit 7
LSVLKLYIDDVFHFSLMKELVLRDNKLLTIPPLSNFKNLTLVDVSFNKLTSLKGMSEVSSTLKELYVSNNEVGKIEEIEHLQSLRVLELGSNKIRVCISLSVW